ncbi:MAG: 50S ribosomal protein L29 [Balneolaceae bacterium]|jgi:large subunit ribosomal protein L29|nr:50S ribosomal protein L29 [Balneolaceae bacterium]
MKATKTTELRELSVADLQTRLEENRTSLRDMRFKKAVSGQLEDPTVLRLTRKEIARIETILTEKQGA